VHTHDYDGQNQEVTKGQQLGKWEMRKQLEVVPRLEHQALLIENLEELNDVMRDEEWLLLKE
jgi:hypothetical protein